MRHLTRFITLIALGLACTLAQAQDNAQRIDLSGRSVFFTTLTVVQGQPGEPQELTINRAAQALETFTQATQLEACGDLTIGPHDVLRIVIGTIHSHVGCVSQTEPLADFTPTGMSIHSHPTRRSFIVNNADVAANSVADSVIEMLHVGQVASVSSKSNTFSATDLREPMSYLVANGRLLYQANGRIHDRGEIASLPIAAPVAIAIAP